MVAVGIAVVGVVAFVAGFLCGVSLDNPWRGF